MAKKIENFGRQAIVTKYLCPTNFKGARVKAFAFAGSVTLGWDHALSVEQNHDRAALAYAEKMEWTERNRLVGGGLPRQFGGNVYVLVPKAGKKGDR